MRARLIFQLLWGLALARLDQPHPHAIPPRDYDAKDYFTVHFKSDLEINSFLEQFPHFQYEHAFRGLDRHHVFSVAKLVPPEQKVHGLNDGELSGIQKRLETHAKLASHPLVKAVHMLEARQLHKRLPIPAEDLLMEPVQHARDKYGIADPEFTKQWHIVNPVLPSDTVNVTGVWDMGISGKNVTVAIIDDGVDFTLEDLKDAFSKEGSWDYNANQNMPMPTLVDDYHGTRCAGEIAAQKNDFCGVGVAMGAKVAGLRILSGRITPEDEAAALMYRNDINDIYLCLWGPADNGMLMQAPPMLVQKAIVKSVLDGRGGRGLLYVFASGNGGFHDDSCNFDGYTNSIYSITVGALDWKGNHPPYSEACAAVLTVTYSLGAGEHIHTTDINGKCSDHHGGTSAAAPLAAGIYALVLEANPNLTWRDVQYITIKSSVQINDKDGGWQEAAIGKNYLHVYGYGKVDAYRMVELAKTWENVKPQAWYYAPVKHVGLEILGDSDGLHIHNSLVTIDGSDVASANFEQIEHVTVTVDITADVRGHVSANLYLPRGTRSRLAVVRPLDKSNEGFRNWTFMSVAHWGETAEGNWTLELINHDENNKVSFHLWGLKFFGTTINASKAKRFPLPGEEDEEEAKQPEHTPEPTPEPTPEASPESSPGPETPEDDQDKEEEGKFRHKLGKHYGEYFFLLVVVGFCICLFYLRAVSGRRPHRRRAEGYEFDIINPESDEESRFSAASPRFDYDLDNESLGALLIRRQAEHRVEDFEIESDDETSGLAAGAQQDTKQEEASK